MQTSQLSPTVPLRTIRSSSLDFYMPWLHSITKDHQGTLPRSHTPPDLASQDMGSILTMLTLGVCPLHLHVNLGWETVFHDDLATLVLNTLIKTSLVARILLYINHQNQRPIGKVRLHFTSPPPPDLHCPPWR